MATTNKAQTKTKKQMTQELLRVSKKKKNQQDKFQYEDAPLNGKKVPAKGKWFFEITKCKPNSYYKLYYKSTDVTEFCQQVGEKYGNEKLLSNKQGKIRLHFFYGSDVTPKTLWEEFKTEQSLDKQKARFRIVPFGEQYTDEQIYDAVDSDSQGTATTDNTGVTVNNEGPYIISDVDCDLVQSFYIDPATFGNASTVFLTKVELYFSKKPARESNASGLESPGVSICILDMTEDGKPDITKIYDKSTVIKDYDNIYATTDAVVATPFAFSSPLQLKTGRHYGIAVSIDDEDYVLWYAKVGDYLVGTNTPCPSPSNKHDGQLFQRRKSNSSTPFLPKTVGDHYTAMTNYDLKFGVCVAKFTANEFNLDIVPEDYEFFTIDTISSTPQFLGGEWVYQETTAITGTVTINKANNIVTGSLTTFTSDITQDDIIIITDGTDTDIVQVRQIISDTQMQLAVGPYFSSSNAQIKVAPIGRIYYYSYDSGIMYLTDSNADRDQAKYFEANNQLIGITSGATANLVSVDDYLFNAFITDFSFNTPSLVSTSATYKFAGTDYNIMSRESKVLDFELPNHCDDYQVIIGSRSNEVQATKINLWTADQAITGQSINTEKTAQMTLNFRHQKSSNFLFEAPNIRSNKMYIATSRWDINNDATNEHTKYGNALSKHISEKLTFLEGRYAEDLKVFATCYRPIGTDVKIYAKIYHTDDPEPFDDKNWTEMVMTDNETKYSSLTNKENVIEYSYSMPFSPPVSEQLDGVITTENGNTTITGVDTTFEDDLVVGQVIRIYNADFPQNYYVTSVGSITSNTEIDITDEIPLASLAGDNFRMQTLSTPYTAFRQGANQNIVRYYNTTGAKFDTYNVVAIKIVLLSESQHVVPYVDDYRTAGVSA